MNCASHSSRDAIGTRAGTSLFTECVNESLQAFFPSNTDHKKDSFHMLSRSDNSRCGASIDVITQHASRRWNARRLVATAPDKHVTDAALSCLRITEQVVLGF